MAEIELPTSAKRRGWGGLIVLVIVGGVLLTMAAFMLARPVDADEVGIMQVYVGSNTGFQEELLEPGVHLVVPGVQRLHRFPKDIQTLDFNDSERSGAKRLLRDDYSWAPSIRIQTSEGYEVTVDATVMYKIVDPYTVLTKVGAGRMFEDQVVSRRADKILRQTLGALNAEEFYDDAIRIAKVEECEEALAAELKEWGIEVWGIMLREYSYDARYQQAIEERKIQDQRVFRNQAESLAATQAAERDRVLAEGQANIEVEGERGRAEVRRIRAEADLYARQKIAEGDLLVALANAKGTEMENKALQAVGAGNLVGLEMAEALEGIEVIIVSTTGKNAVNPLDLDSLVEGF